MQMQYYGYEDAAMTNGFTFKIGIRRKKGLFGLFDDLPDIRKIRLPLNTSPHDDAGRKDK
jgi:hypothetical protein